MQFIAVIQIEPLIRANPHQSATIFGDRVDSVSIGIGFDGLKTMSRCVSGIDMTCDSGQYGYDYNG